MNRNERELLDWLIANQSFEMFTIFNVARLRLEVDVIEAIGEESAEKIFVGGLKELRKLERLVQINDKRGVDHETV